MLLLNRRKQHCNILARGLLNISTQIRSKVTQKQNSLRNDRIDDLKKLRNIGIIAHINAGKTTTTERILYHSGTTNVVGDVDKGNTVTDYLVQERDRGITITSAAVQFKWNKHHINLIDTPGHVDFTFEVERSLAVLDGAVTLLDSSAGVEAQTITVWNQARKYQLPNIIFLNKYDKPMADYEMCLRDLKNTLDINTTLVQLPVKSKESNKKFSSIIDVIHKRCISWMYPDSDKGNKFVSEPAIESSVLDKRYLDLIDEARESMVNKLCDVDEKLANHVIECDKISDVSGNIIAEALRRSTLDCKLSPVLLGSSFKYIGVQQLMDAIINYLPNPLEREKKLMSLLNEEKVIPFDASTVNVETPTAFIFKVMHDTRLGCLSYAKILNGSVKQGQKFKTLDDSKPEAIKRIYRPFADDLSEFEGSVSKHDIVVFTGLTDTKTGDILVDTNLSIDNYEQDNSSAKGAIKKSQENQVDSSQMLPFKTIATKSNQLIIIPEIHQLDPVYFCSIESKNMAQQLKLEHALNCLAKEDPSFTYEIDKFGQTTIKGMGKLHLEVMRDRIESEYKIQPLLGSLQISYRETIDSSTTEEFSVDKMINGVKSIARVKIFVKPKPMGGVWRPKMLRLDMSRESTLGNLRLDHRKAIENGILSALGHGPLMGYPLINCDILLIDFEANRRCGLPVISSMTAQCLTNALQRCTPILLEPIMLLEVVSPKEYNKQILSDLSNRRGIIQTNVVRGNDSNVVRAEVPLSTLSDYCESLRISTSGRGTFSMELYNYYALSEAEKRNIVKL